MTGILPIAKYSSGSELNMFFEYSMATRAKFSEYFGFTDDEVNLLYQRYLQIEKKSFRYAGRIGIMVRWLSDRRRKKTL